MARKDLEPVFIAAFESLDDAEQAWATLVDQGLAGSIITDDPPWGPRLHRIQVARQDADAALLALQSGS